MPSNDNDATDDQILRAVKANTADAEPAAGSLQPPGATPLPADAADAEPLAGSRQPPGGPPDADSTHPVVPPPTPTPSRARPTRWPLAIAMVTAFVVAAVVSGGVWAFANGGLPWLSPANAEGGNGANGEAAGGTGAGGDRTALDPARVHDTVEVGDPDSTAAEPENAQPPQWLVLENLGSAAFPGDCGIDSGKFTNGIYAADSRGAAYIALPWVKDPRAGSNLKSPDVYVAFGDITGDGIDDVATFLACESGGTVEWPGQVAFYEVAPDGTPTLLGGVSPFVAEGVVAKSQVSAITAPSYAAGAFTVEVRTDTTGADSHASATADTEYTLTYSAPNGALVQTGRSEASI